MTEVLTIGPKAAVRVAKLELLPNLTPLADAIIVKGAIFCTKDVKASLKSAAQAIASAPNVLSGRFPAQHLGTNREQIAQSQIRQALFYSSKYDLDLLSHLWVGWLLIA